MIPSCVGQAARDPAIRGVTLSVYVVLLEYLDFVEFRPAKRASLSRQLAITEPAVSRAIASLVRRGYIFRGADIGTLNTYRLAVSPNPIGITSVLSKVA